MRGNEVEGGRKMHTHARETPEWEEVLDYPEETKPLGGILQLAWKGLKIPTADPRICSTKMIRTICAPSTQQRDFNMRLRQTFLSLEY